MAEAFGFLIMLCLYGFIGLIALAGTGFLIIGIYAAVAVIIASLRNLVK